MTELDLRLSVPQRIRRAPRQLSPEEWATLEAVADCLVPASGESPKASDAPGYRDWVGRALAARAEHFDVVVAALASLFALAASELRVRLEAMHGEQPEQFAVLSSVVAGAYLMVPVVREQIGYPGQGGAAPRMDEAAEQLEDGILDPVVARGPIYTPGAGE